MNIDILGISELKWTGMGEFNSDDHYIYYGGQESLGRNGVALIVNKRVCHVLLGCKLKNDRMISVHFQGKSFNITVIQVYALTNNAKEAEVEQFYEDLYGCESWIVKKAEGRRIDAFELWCWRRLESPLDCKQIHPVHSEGEQPWGFFGRNDAKAETQYFGHLMRRVDSLEKTVMLGGIEGRRRKD